VGYCVRWLRGVMYEVKEEQWIWGTGDGEVRIIREENNDTGAVVSYILSLLYTVKGPGLSFLSL